MSKQINASFTLTDLEEAMIKELSDNIRVEMDNSILVEMFINMGHQQIILLDCDRLAVNEWIKESCPGAVLVGDTFLYKNPEYATMCRLKWL